MKRALCKLPSLAKEGAKREPDRAKHQERLRPLTKWRAASLAGAGGVVGSSHRLSVVERTTPAAPSKERDHFLDGAATPPFPRRGVFAALCLFLLLCGCRQAMPGQATWNGTIELAEGKIILPFQMDLDVRSTKPQGYFLVGNEKAPIPEITQQGNSLAFGFSEYGAEMRGAWDGSQLKGTYVRHRGEQTTTLKFSVSPKMLVATQPAQPAGATPTGKYQVYFEKENRNESATVASFW